jgi:hypothetical protein
MLAPCPTPNRRHTDTDTDTRTRTRTRTQHTHITIVVAIIHTHIKDLVTQEGPLPLSFAHSSSITIRQGACSRSEHLRESLPAETALATRGWGEGDGGTAVAVHKLAQLAACLERRAR